MTRNFEAKEASEARKDKPQSLLFALTGASGSGKSRSALELATGIQSVVGGDIYGVDSEQRRMLHYAEAFKFKHVEFKAPYGADDYLEALRFCKKQGAGVAIIDTCSLEHEGPGGMLEQHEAELTRMAGTDYAKRERCTMLAWQKPKAARRRLITAITTELDIPVIFCFRAKMSTKPMKNKDGKLVPVEQGYTLIGGEEWPFELGFNALLMPGCKGVPKWHSDMPGEIRTIKMTDQFKWLESETGPFDQAMGRRLAEWSLYGSKGRPEGKAAMSRQSPSDWLENYLTDLYAADSLVDIDRVVSKNAAALAKLEAAHPELSARAVEALQRRRGEFVSDGIDPFDAGES